MYECVHHTYIYIYTYYIICVHLFIKYEAHIIWYIYIYIPYRIIYYIYVVCCNIVSVPRCEFWFIVFSPSMILQGLTFFWGWNHGQGKYRPVLIQLLFVDIPQALRQFYHPSYWQQSSYTLESPKQPKEVQLFAEYTHLFIYFTYLAYLIINYFLYTRTWMICMICIYYRVMCANMSCLNGMAIWHLAIIVTDAASAETTFHGLAE